MKTAIDSNKVTSTEIMQSMIVSFQIENIEISEEYAVASLARAEEKLRKLKK